MIGHSLHRQPIEATTLGHGPRRIYLIGLIHGNEPEGLAILPQLCEELNHPDQLEMTAVRLVRNMNPDGAKAGSRGNARGVDLNRNFPLPWGRRPSRWPGSGSSRPGDATYRGQAPLSEPETRALAALLERVDPHAAVGLHSFMGTVIPPCCTHAEDRRVYAALAATFARHQRGARYRRLSSAVFDVFTGELEDWQHHARGTWAVCVEVFSLGGSLAQSGLRAPSAFWRFNPRDPAPWVASDVPALHALLGAALDRERPPLREGASACLDSWDGRAPAADPPVRAGR